MYETRLVTARVESDDRAVPATDDELARLTESRLRRAYGLAGYILGDAREAEEAAQEAAARAWQARGKLRDLSTFDAWFERIVVNVCRDRMRRARVIRFVELEEGDSVTAGDPFRTFLAADELGRALEVLTPEQRIVVVLRFWRDLPLEAIAARLDWPVGTVKSRLHHALAALRTRLERDLEGGLR